MEGSLDQMTEDKKVHQPIDCLSMMVVHGHLQFCPISAKAKGGLVNSTIGLINGAMVNLSYLVYLKLN